MASVLPFPDNQSEDKHVESKLVPRLDEGSNPSISTKALDYQEPFLLGDSVIAGCLPRLVPIYYAKDNALAFATAVFIPVLAYQIFKSMFS